MSTIASPAGRPPHRRRRMDVATTVAIMVAVVALRLPACANADEDTDSLMIFAAASLNEALPAAVAALRDSLPGVEVNYNFAASSFLAKQILAGSPATLFISANPEWIDELERAGRVEPGASVTLLGNRLVVVVPQAAPVRLTSLPDLTSPAIRYIALGDPAHVPAGTYAKSVLEHAGLWAQVRSKIVSGHDVRGALAFVESGDADAAIVYATDAAISSRVRLAFTIPDSLQPPIRYVLACVGEAEPRCERVARLLQSPPAARQFERFGFRMLAAEGVD